MPEAPQEWLPWLPRSVAFLLFFAFTFLHRRFLWWLETSGRLQRIPVCYRRMLMPYMWMCAFFAALVIEDLLVTAVHEFANGELTYCSNGDAGLGDYANHQFTKHGMGKHHTDCKAVPRPLFLLSLSAPVAIGLCCCTCIAHTMQHAAECRWELLTYGHEMATQIGNLPIVYGMLSFKSIVSIWQAMTDPAKLVAYDLQAFDINYSVADCYEAWALFCFGRVCMLYLENAASWETAEARDLMTPLQRLLLQGLLSFCVIQLCTAMYSMMITSLQSHGICELHVELCKLDQYFNGAVFALSCLAIMNMVVFERTLGSYVQNLKPKFKFFYAKCLLSITCLQRVTLGILSPVLQLTQLENDLLYASLVCIECCLLSLVNWYAWHPKALWHDMVVRSPSIHRRIELRSRGRRDQEASQAPRPPQPGPVLATSGRLSSPLVEEKPPSVAIDVVDRL